VKERLDRQFTALEQHPELDFIFGLEAKFADETQWEPCEIKERDVLDCLNSAKCMVPDPFGLLLKENFIPTSTVLFRKSCIATTGLMDPALKLAEDYEFWIRFALHGYRFGFINAILCRRRLHQGNLVNQKWKIKASVAEVLGRYRDYSPAHRERAARRLSRLHYDMGSHLLYQRDFGHALKHLCQANPTGRTRIVWAAKLAVARLLCN
jgi:GT2 family glycosyltransferase